MFLQRFYDDALAQASYLVGCAATGEALVVDPSRDVAQYIDTAKREGLRVTHVTETHIHADFVSGARELAAATGARLLLSAEGGAEWQYTYASEDGATLLRDGDTFRIGNVRVEVMHTPGHTPEHLCFVITDTAAADRPMGVFTGDFIFVGAVGRPDLLERAVHLQGTMEAGARQLFASLRRFKATLPDWVQLWPGHGAGSACGKSLGAVPTTTLGYEVLFNRGLAETDEAAFVAEVLAGQPEPPMYFAEMKRMNREGPRVLGSLPRPARLPDAELARVLADGGVVVDARPAPEFARRHVPGTLSVPLGKSFPTWAGSVLSYDRDFHLLAPAGADDDRMADAARSLAMIGLDRVAGWFAASAIDGAVADAGRAGEVPDVQPDGLDDALASGAELVDVRNSSEFAAGHLPGAVNLPLGRLAERVDELPRGRTLVIHCQSGARAGVAASLLAARGFDDVRHLAGDYAGWTAAGRPVEKGEPVPA
ncbi:MBL fold metallo-hydrolase [Longimicrobium sp.]|uniref:MBL fold metallo-hydrolase n=1 Tax=Longimicrobium sp. TaxID=2029185 RepID=UPI002E3090A3|nr:MBL fold metallo-hydrolase [Longimicrobium sp.]HEX6040526.1 MBL fold metallo-hydrolase [Longimicrobium sp.]